ncbi:MAG: MarR family transcriptional regulator [Tardiphaga sp.]|uniref:MarR family winged helix-turn-helix transcriptional regulator n=1 Tax=Tardiphaga sp. TaxID=1926292 RepID=UPI00260971C6|nr:MarR family winged helix-turn-helix transcriptional regulator [Tardiphaga sp.]MDB5500954.1 MarR family transcriptional regulator [Tardiphaga sp.]
MKTRTQGGNAGRRARHVRALGEALHGLVSEARAVTAQAAAMFHPELQPAAFHIALWLHSFGPAKPSAVAQAVAMDRSAASRLTGELVRLKLVKSATDAADKRAVVLSLTADGRRRIEAAMQAKGATFQHRVAAWSEDDLVRCTELLRRLTEGTVADQRREEAVSPSGGRAPNTATPQPR